MARPRNPSPHTAAPPWAWCWAGALSGVLLCALLLPPAHWLAQLLHRASDGHVQLRQPQGTLWRGSAALVLTGGNGSRDAMRLPQRLQWQLRPGWGGLQLTLHASCCTTQPFELQLSPAWPGVKLSIAANRSQWPAQLLNGLGAPWNTLALEGQLVLTNDTLQATASAQHFAIEGALSLDALDLASRLTTLRPMGSYRIRLQGGTSPALDLSTLAGPLRLRGQGQWQGSHLSFAGEASAEPAQEAELANLLNIIGRREGARSVITLRL